MTGAPADRTPKPGFARFVPLILFLALGAVFAGYLVATTFFGYDRDALPSTLIGRPAPAMDLPALHEGGAGLTAAMLQAPGVKVVNVWASWCVPCRAEHPLLIELKQAGVTLYGINHRDEPANAKRFLADLGDPFDGIGTDRSGRAGVEWGVYGVPETFVVDGQGRIVYKHVGPINPGDLERRIWPAIRQAGG